MPSTEVSVEVPSASEAVWSWVADPGRLPRWWPSVDRVDRTGDSSFTKWVTSPRGRAVPMRFELDELVPGEKIVWRQELDGTPFEKAISQSRESVEVHPNGSGSVVRIGIARKLKGTARLGRLFVSRGQKKELASAAAALQGVFE